MANDIWWEIYRKYLIDVSLKNKLSLGSLLLSTPPMIFLTLVVFFYVADSSMNYTIFALNALGIIMIIYWTNVFSRNIARQVHDLSKDAKEIAAGNLDYKVKAIESKDEVGLMVTSVKQMLQNLVNSLQSTASVIQGMGEAVYITDTDLKITQFTPAAEKLLGYSEAEVIGKPCHEVIKYSGDVEACNAPDSPSVKIIEGRESLVSKVLTLISKSGDLVISEITTSPYLDGSGDVIGAVALIKDLRKFVEKENEIKEGKRVLEERVDSILPVVLAASQGDLTQEIEKAENFEAECPKCRSDQKSPVPKIYYTYSGSNIFKGKCPSCGSEDEIKDDALGKLAGATGSMIKNLHELVVQVIEMSLSVSSTSEELASASQQMNATTEEVSSSVTQISQGAQTQVSQLNMASGEMKDMAKMIQNIAASAQSAAEVAESANAVAHEGGKDAEKAVTKMRDANQVVNESSEIVIELGQTSKQIGEIVSLITNIAEQTNLLALNAAIEAARAGEHGRGFAVVAEEVSKLADGSGAAAKQIADLISGMQTNTENAVESMERGATEVNEATTVVDKALGALETILEGVSEVTAKVEEISNATQTQSMTTETVVKAIDDITTAAETAAASTEQVSAATEEQTASMEEITSTAQSLANMAVDQERIAKKFKIREGEAKETKSSNPDETQD